MKESALEMTPGDLVTDEATGDQRHAYFEAETERRFGVTDGAVREAMKPLFLLMFRHGIRNFTIERNGTRAGVLFS